MFGEWFDCIELCSDLLTGVTVVGDQLSCFVLPDNSLVTVVEWLGGIVLSGDWLPAVVVPRLWLITGLVLSCVVPVCDGLVVVGLPVD